MGLPYTPSHPDDDYRILRLQAAIPTDSGGGGVIVQSVELCFHAGFHPDRETALSLHISEGRVTVSRPRALEGEPPPNGLIINCGRVDLFNEDRLDDLVLPLSPLPPEIRCFSRISTGNRIACAIAAMTIIAFAFFSFQWQPTAPAPMVPFLPLQYLLNSTVRIPLISFNLFFNIDEKLHRDPRIPVPITPQPPMMITNTETTTLVKNLTKTIINIFDDRLASLPSAHHLDEHALVCGQSQHSLTMLAELVEVYKLKAQSFWGSTSLDIGLGLHLDLEERLFALAGALDAILVGELDAGVFSYGSLKHAPPYYGDMPGPAAQNLVESYREYFTWLSRYVDMLQWCPMVDYLAPDFPLRPFRPLRETSHAEHDDFLVSLQRNLSSWVLETELKRLRYSRVDDISWQQPHPLLQLAYYVTGLHALTSHIHSIARSVMGCQAAWPQASEPRLWIPSSQSSRPHYPTFSHKQTVHAYLRSFERGGDTGPYCGRGIN
uniref:Uncharacterized protein n=1 Tax=Gibberella zeae TaxID=5518 RepID=A0A4E9DVD3_GIBZA